MTETLAYIDSRDGDGGEVNIGAFQNSEGEFMIRCVRVSGGEEFWDRFKKEFSFKGEATIVFVDDPEGSAR